MDLKKIKVLGIIPARKGSKGIKNKNFKKVKKRRLIDYTFIEAKKSKYISKIVLTTDDPRIIQHSKKYKIDYIIKRKKTISKDNSKTNLAILDILEKIKNFNPDLLILLQPTSPLRKSKHIDEALKIFCKNSKKYNSLVSVTKLEEPHPYKLKKIKNNYLLPFLNGKDSEMPRQKMEKIFKLNGAIYIVKKDIFLKKKTFLDKTLPYIMDEKFSLNIDIELDFKYLKSIVSE